MTEKQHEKQHEKQTGSLSEDPEGEIDSLLADLWQRHLPSLRERLDLLTRTAAQAATGTLDEAARAEAQSVAHKLSGNLGMFGHHKAGRHRQSDRAHPQGPHAPDASSPRRSRPGPARNPRRKHPGVKERTKQQPGGGQ